MISGLDKSKLFSRRKNVIGAGGKTLEIGFREQACTRIALNEFSYGLPPIAHDEGKPLSGDRKNVSRSFVRKTVVENSGFARAWRVSLQDERRGYNSEIVLRLRERFDFPKTKSSLCDIRLEHKRKLQSFFVEESSDSGQTLGGCTCLDQVAVGR